MAKLKPILFNTAMVQKIMAGEKTETRRVVLPQPEGARSGAGDLDLVIYSLRKWARLAAQGNPTVLLLLFVPDDAGAEGALGQFVAPPTRLPWFQEAAAFRAQRIPLAIVLKTGQAQEMSVAG